MAAGEMRPVCLKLMKVLKDIGVSAEKLKDYVPPAKPDAFKEELGAVGFQLH